MRNNGPFDNNLTEMKNCSNTMNSCIFEDEEIKLNYFIKVRKDFLNKVVELSLFFVQKIQKIESLKIEIESSKSKKIFYLFYEEFFFQDLGIIEKKISNSKENSSSFSKEYIIQNENNDHFNFVTIQFSYMYCFIFMKFINNLFFTKL